jgi:LCP family protein required for cell wall assembly
MWPFKRDPDPFAPSRYGEMFRSSRSRERKHMRKKWQWWLLLGFIVITLLSAWGIWRYYKLQGRIQTDVDTQAEQAGEPFNVLLVGSDSRGDLTPEEQEELGANAIDGARADTLIVGHVDPAEDHVTMLQFPRDLYVPIAGTTEQRKINEALLYGRRALVKTVEDLLGITINRYVEVNIAGFRDVVDAIGGVDVCVPETVEFDPNTGFSVTKPGTITFDGDLALRFVRSRHAFANGDFDRIANQQKFLSAALRKVTSAGILLRPQAVVKLIGEVEQNLRIDANTTLPGVRRILERFRTFDPARYEAYVAPNFGTDNITLPSGSPYSIVVPDMERIELIGQALADNESPAEADGAPSIDPKTVRVGVFNGVDLFRPYASDAAQALTEATGGEDGVVIADIANAPHFKFKESVIRYEPEAEEMAQLIAAVLPDAALQEHSTPEGVDVSVIVGDGRFRTEKLLQILPIPIPKPEEQPAVCEQQGQTGDPNG